MAWEIARRKQVRFQSPSEEIRGILDNLPPDEGSEIERRLFKLMGSDGEVFLSLNDLAYIGNCLEGWLGGKKQRKKRKNMTKNLVKLLQIKVVEKLQTVADLGCSIKKLNKSIKAKTGHDCGTPITHGAGAY